MNKFWLVTALVGCTSSPAPSGPDAGQGKASVVRSAEGLEALLQASIRYRNTHFAVLNAAEATAAKLAVTQAALAKLDVPKRTPIVNSVETDGREVLGQLEGLLRRLNLKATVKLATEPPIRPAPQRLPASVQDGYSNAQVMGRHRFEIRLASAQDAQLLIDGAAQLTRLFVPHAQKKTLADGRISLVGEFPYLRALAPVDFDAKPSDYTTALRRLEASPHWQAASEDVADEIRENYRRVARRREVLESALRTQATLMLAEARLRAFNERLAAFKASTQPKRTISD